MEEDFLIPVDDAIKAFRLHLDAHDRTILSARFGDGKSFFLSHFMEDVDVKERYTFLTIFPVNYQVTENRDIFDLIKRDILFQMLLKGIIETDVKIPNEVALALYLQNEPLGFAESFLPLLSEYALSGDAAKAAAVALAGKKFFKTIKQKLDNVKKQSRDEQLMAFLKAVEQNPVVGQDAISGIIQQCIELYKKKHPDRQVVLVIEDLDRIDPAHLFRILNIFSAHIDFCYRFGCKPDKSLVGNKFGLDKVVFVMDYENVQKIYGHFYGSETNFEGYIEKFCSSNYFRYSLQELRGSYLIEYISKETGLPKTALNYIIKLDDISSMSVRKAVNAINNSNKLVIRIPEIMNSEHKTVPFHPGVLRLVAILRKLGISDAEIVNRIKNAIVHKDASKSGILLYTAHYLTFLKYKNPFADLRFAISMSIPNYVSVHNVDEEGRAACIFSTSYNDENNAELNLQKLLNKLIQLVAK